MIVVATLPDRVNLVAAFGTAGAALAAAFAAGVAAHSAHLSRITADATVKSAQASEKAAVANATTADLMRQQWEDEQRHREAARLERHGGLLLALRLECEQIAENWRNGVIRPQQIGVWDQHAAEIAISYPVVAETTKDAAIMVEVANWFMELRHEPIPTETKNLGIDAEVHLRIKRSDTAREAAAGAAGKVQAVADAIKAAARSD